MLDPAATPFSGAVLAGGASRRMGCDKAFALCDGVPLADIARRALIEAGAREVLSIGGDEARLGGLGFTTVPDDAAGEGPLGGLVTALRAAVEEWVAVLACDLPRANAATVRELLAHTGPGTDAVVPLLVGRPQPDHAVWRRDSRALLAPLFAAGERRLGAAVGHVRARLVTVADPATLADVDTPDDLATLGSAKSAT
ncbi:MAG: molybdenum cofactor guanylyltransferase [bacterium]|nr:molybdenum cofactor guanylyltransferase [bacterium]